MFSFATGNEIGSPMQVLSYKRQKEGLTQPVAQQISIVATDSEASDKDSNEKKTFRACVVLITGGKNFNSTTH